MKKNKEKTKKSEERRKRGKRNKNMGKFPPTLRIYWEPVDYLQGPELGPFEGLENQKVSKKSGESGKSLEKVPKEPF